MKILFLLSFLTFGFQLNAAESEYLTWKNQRLEGLQQPHGWLSLVGLEWLRKGKNTIGSADDNDIKLSHGPNYLGVFTLANDKQVSFEPNTAVLIMANDQAVTDTIAVYADTSEQETTVFTIDSFLFYMVERDNMAIRIKDSAAKTRSNFKGLSYFPEVEKFRVDAIFTPYQPAKIIPTVNVFGILSNEESPGSLAFVIDGQAFSLDVFDSVDSYYIIFADKTNGKSTYGPGRFLYTDDKANDQGVVRIDFNKSYNPPCAFTPYSTCTLPPLQNRMNLSVEAGELKYAESVY